MSIRLTEAELADVAAMQRLLLDPFAYPDMAAWGKAVVERWRRAIGADSAVLALPSEAGLRASLSDSALVSATQEYETEFKERDVGLIERLPLLDDPHVSHEGDVFRRSELLRDEAFVDWRTPNKLFDPLLMAIPSEHVTPAILIAYRERDSEYRLNRKAALARLVFPAFEHAVRFWYQGDRWKGEVERFVTEAAQGCLLFGVGGTLVHANRRAERIIRQREPGEVLLEEARRMAVGLLSPTQVVPRVTVQVGSIRLSGLRLGREEIATVKSTIGTESLDAYRRSPFGFALIVLENLDRRLPDARTLRERFGLSPRQAEVALLLARRKTDKEIARTLGVRLNTARRHCALVLRALSVHSRRDVEVVIRGGDRKDQP